MWVAPHPMGPWKDTGVDLNPEMGHFWDEHHVIKAQENNVIEVTAPSTNATTYLYTGDRWSSAPDKLKSHDFQYWYPLSFNDSNVPPTIAPLKWVDSFTVEVS